jgi:nucleotide-binding universal stress UspA family protein
MKILVPVDGSEFSKRMLAYLAAHDDFMGPQHDYTVLHVVPAVPPRAAAVMDKQTLDDYYGDEAEKVFKPIREFFTRQGLTTVKFVREIGHAAEVISKLADAGGYELLVLGSHGHGSLAGLVMGSTSTKVLAHCGVPVLLIR